MIAPRYKGQLSREDLRDIAKRFLEVIDKEKICSLEDLNKKNGQVFPRRLFPRDFIKIELRPSKQGAHANTISYIIPGIGIPIEARINPSLNYSVMIAKTDSEIPGYIKLTEDNFGNIIQDKFLNSTDFSSIRKELEVLAQDENG